VSSLRLLLRSKQMHKGQTVSAVAVPNLTSNLESRLQFDGHFLAVELITMNSLSSSCSCSCSMRETSCS
jgi:hypothetical protein